MNRFAFLLAIFALLALPVKGALAGDINIVNIAVPASLTPTSTSGLLYLEIENKGQAADKLVAVSTPMATSAMLHESYQEGDIARMRMLPDVELPPGITTQLKQGGKHVMLTGLKAPLKKGDSITITFTFEKAGITEIQATVGEPVTGKLPDK